MRAKQASEIRQGLRIGHLVAWYVAHCAGVDPHQIKFYTLAKSRTARKARDRVIERQEKKR